MKFNLRRLRAEAIAKITKSTPTRDFDFWMAIIATVEIQKAFRRPFISREFVNDWAGLRNFGPITVNSTDQLLTLATKRLIPHEPKRKKI